MRSHDENREFPELERAARALPRSIEPARDLWPGIEARIRRRGRRPLLWIPLAAAAAVAALVVARGGLSRGGWEVAPLAGVPELARRPLTDTGRLRVGKWLETDGRSRAHVRVGEIGELHVEPRTRLGLVAARPTEHRLALARGTIVARVSAPPRVFIVETPSAVAVDLGCAYRLEVDSAGNGLLHVTAGLVEFGAGGRTSIVPVGALAPTRQGYGPGVPYVADAPEALRRALAALEFERAGPPALRRALAAARYQDGLSLWHLLGRVEAPLRGLVYDRLTALVPAPVGVTREGVLHLDQRMLDTYWNYIPGTVWRPGWSPAGP